MARVPVRWVTLRGVAVLVLLTTAAALYVVDHDGIGEWALAVAQGLAALGVALGPFVRGAKPPLLFVGATAGALCLVAANATPYPVRIWGEFRLGLVFYFLGYVCFGVWFAAMAWRAGRGTAARALVDTVAGLAAALITLWAVADHRRHISPAQTLDWGFFPLLDAVMLVLAAHLALRLGRRVPAWWWVFTGLVIQFAIDAVAALLLFPRGSTGWLVIGGLGAFSYGCLAAGATHPSVVELAKTRESSSGFDDDWRTRTVFVVAAVVFAVAALVQPPHDSDDALVRSIGVAVLLLLLVARLLLAILDLQRVERASRHRATHDELTGLINRAALFDVLEQRLARRRPGVSLAVLFVDCDDFKHVNDTWGHRAGDTLLRVLASRLPARLASGVVLARHGGDEFVLVTDVTDAGQAVRLAEQVRSVFDEPIEILPDRRYRVTPSIGIAIGRLDGDESADDLVAHADIALYEAKARGRARHVVFDDELAERSSRRVYLANALRDALARDDRFAVELQAIVGGPRYETLIGWEALLRWHDPEAGDVPPDVFVPLAEDYGLIGELGERVLVHACREVAALRDRTGHDVVVSVNVSPAQLRSEDFVDRVHDALRDSGLPADRLWLEITETLLVDKSRDVIERLRVLRASGVSIGIDDFGTGYASFATVRRIPADYVKIDRSIVAHVDVDPRAREQLAALLALLATLRIHRIVAEGVETRAQAEALHELGCEFVQGWYYGRPTPPAEVSGSLVAFGAPAAAQANNA